MIKRKAFKLICNLALTPNFLRKRDAVNPHCQHNHTQNILFFKNLKSKCSNFLYDRLSKKNNLVKEKMKTPEYD